ncbi:MAG: carotenoid biosynthesis protein [Aphanocapsa sp. GSE-SYN-MK-11-07L]|jgi:putative membrane protein|nr:carotenoid biosynthesis protein [Aphanocapsa sp. GSE-SYN-MK-11-07L]
MKPILIAERVCLITHVAAMIFGLAGLLLVLPHPDFVLSLPSFGQRLFQWSMAGGGVVYIILGAAAVALHAYRTLGTAKLLTFLLPAVLISAGSELLGTSTGFPFGHYAYLNGLGYKIAGLVPFTIPLSWFYMGLSAFLLAYCGLFSRSAGRAWSVGWLSALSVLVGAILLTSWDFVLDPAMSQAPVPFWEFQEIGAFFGMPYRNLAGWTGTGAIFMAVAALLWRHSPILLSRSQLIVPLITYLVNFGFGAAITLVSLDQRYWIPTAIGVVLGVIPALALWWSAPISLQDELTDPIQVEALTAPPLEVVSK